MASPSPSSPQHAMVLPAQSGIKRKRAPSETSTSPSETKRSKANTPNIEDFAAFLRAYKKLQYDKGTLAAELQETKAKLKTAEIDRINDFEDQNILRQELVQEKAELKVELAELDVQYDALKDEVEEVKDENDDLKEVNQELKRQVKGLEQEVKKGVKSFDAYKKRVRALGNEM